MGKSGGRKNKGGGGSKQVSSSENTGSSKPTVNGGIDFDASIFVKRAHELKEEGNKKFQGKDFVGALEQYSDGLKLIPKNHPDRAVFKMKEGGKFEASSSNRVFQDSEEDEEEHSCLSVSSSDEEEETGKELTFEEIHKLRADGSRAVPRKPNQVKKKTGRANKNRPMELSSKKPVSRFREVIQVPKKVVRDPRFDSLGGKVDLEGFRKRYNFFFEEKLPAEREELRKQLKKTKNPVEVEELKSQLSQVEKLLKYDPSTKNKGTAILTQHKKKEREAAKEGKKPYYLKKSEIQKQILIEKYNNLKESGKLSSFLDKRRKKNATKDHRYMPYRRADASEQ